MLCVCVCVCECVPCMCMCICMCVFARARGCVCAACVLATWVCNCGIGVRQLVDIHSTTLAEIVRRHFPRYSSFPHPAFYFHKSVDQVSSGGDAVSGTGTAANTRAEGSVQIDSQLSITWVLDAATFAGTLQLQDVACNQQAWMGMGLGSNMFDADVVLCEWTGSVMQCTDRHASGLEVPAEDTAAQGRDVTLTASSCEDGVLSASFTRPATATDGNADKAFTTGSQVGAPRLRLLVVVLVVSRVVLGFGQPAIFAYKEDSGLAYHGQNRYSLIVDFGSGASVAVSSARDIRRHIVHGVAMFIAWGILAPMGMCVAVLVWLCLCGCVRLFVAVWLCVWLCIVVYGCV